MGRYYTGDIEGKFWFAVQSSDDASFFGGSEYDPQTVHYSFVITDLPDIEAGIAKCKKALGRNEKRLNKFFKDHNGYNDEMISESLKIKEENARTILEWYARLELGEKIYKQVKETGHCDFEAET